MQDIILALDLSIVSTGYAFMKYDSEVICTGTICPEKYKNHSKDKYPVSTLKNIVSDVLQISEIVKEYSEEYNITDIIIEEINASAGGTKTIKALSWIQGFLLEELDPSKFNFEFITCSTWRSALGLRYSASDKEHNKPLKKRHKDRITFKHLAINKVNKIYGTDFKLEDNDITDSICIGLAHLKINKGLQIK